MSLVLEVEHHGSGNTALVKFRNVVHADEILSSKGFRRVCGELFWAGFDKAGHEVSVIEGLEIVTSLQRSKDILEHQNRELVLQCQKLAKENAVLKERFKHILLELTKMADGWIDDPKIEKYGCSVALCDFLEKNTFSC